MKFRVITEPVGIDPASLHYFPRGTVVEVVPGSRAYPDGSREYQGPSGEGFEMIQRLEARDVEPEPTNRKEPTP